MLRAGTNAKRVLQLWRDFFRLWKDRRQLIFVLTYREITDRFAGSIVGGIWAIAHPLVMMAVYVFVFTAIFKIRFGETTSLQGISYTAYFIAGYLPWMTLSDALMRSCMSIVYSSNLVKQVVFPIEVLPLRTVLSSFLPQAIGTIFLLGYLPYSSNGHFPATLALLPIAIAIQFIGMAGLAFLLSSIAVFLRDIKEGVQVFVTLGMYLLPILYIPGMLAQSMEIALLVNPFSHLIWMHHDIWIHGSIQHPYSWAIAAVLSFGIFVLGFGVFRRLKPVFGNNL